MFNFVISMNICICVAKGSVLYFCLQPKRYARQIVISTEFFVLEYSGVLCICNVFSYQSTRNPKPNKLNAYIHMRICHTSETRINQYSKNSARTLVVNVPWYLYVLCIGLYSMYS